MSCKNQKNNIFESLKNNPKIIEIAYFEPAEDDLKKLQENEELYKKYLKINIFKFFYLVDNFKVTGYLSIPRKNINGDFPCIIYNRGGNRNFGKLHPFSLIEYTSWGYLTIASQYRGVDGGDGMEEFGGKDINDVLELIPILENIPSVDKNKIGMIGWSRGGMMTYLSLTKTDKIKAAVIGAGMANLLGSIDNRPEMESKVYSQLIPQYWNNKEDELKRRSAVHFADDINENTPILILHGSSDWRVDPQDSLDMANILYKNNHPFRLYFFEGGDHGLTEYRDQVFKMVKEWFDYYVKENRLLPNMNPHGP